MIDTKGYKITKLGEYSYSLFSKGEYKKQIYSSLLKTNILTSAFFDPHSNSIFFTAESVQLLSEYLNTKSYNKMSEPECAQLITNITSQIKYLEEHKYVLYGYDLNDILVISDNIFIAANSNYILPLENNTFTFSNPNNRPYFSNPELLELTKLPSIIHYKSSYYSLGVLITFCLLNTYYTSELEVILKPIFYTKIYWFIKRCLNKKYEQRVLLYI